MIDDVYNRKILAFAGNIERIGRLESPDATAKAHSKLCGSTVIVEYLFNLPGMGKLVVGAAQEGDFPVVQGAVLATALIYVVVNSLIDLSYGLIDPRTRRVHA